MKLSMGSAEIAPAMTIPNTIHLAKSLNRSPKAYCAASRTRPPNPFGTWVSAGEFPSPAEQQQDGSDAGTGSGSCLVVQFVANPAMIAVKAAEMGRKMAKIGPSKA